MSHAPQDAPYLLIGANVRFLAGNAVRHGHAIQIVDYYGDWDTRRLAPTRSLKRERVGAPSLGALVDLAEGIANKGVIYGPGFENDLAALARLAPLGRVLGCGMESVRNARNPVALARAAGTWNLRYPPVAFRRSESLAPGRWLAKPYHGMGGAGVLDLADPAAAGATQVFYQKFVPGMASSAAILSDGSSATVVAVFTQIVGDPDFGASGFRFVGNVYPHPFADEMGKRVTDMAEALTLEFDLKGLWGFDFVYDGEVNLIEINPRPSSSLGVLGAATLTDLVALHVGGSTGDTSRLYLDAAPAGTYTAQARVFARAEGVFSCAQNWARRGARDIPEDGEIIAAGAPILTLAAADSSYSGVIARLKEQAAELYAGMERSTASVA